MQIEEVSIGGKRLRGDKQRPGLPAVEVMVAATRVFVPHSWTASLPISEDMGNHRTIEAWPGYTKDQELISPNATHLEVLCVRSSNG